MTTDIIQDQQTISGVANVDARTILGSGDTPRPSDTTTRSSTATQQEPTSSGLLDLDGTTFDRTRHQLDPFGNPKKTAKGVWAKKTGNGALRLQGRPMTGRLPPGGGRPKDPEPGPVAPAAAETSAPSSSGTLPGGSTFVPPRSSTPGMSGPVDGIPLEGPVPLTEAEYQTTAKAVVEGALGMAKMARGDHWEATSAERSQLTESVARVWAAYQLPRLGPVVELLMILVGFIANQAKRAGDMRILWKWLLGKKSAPVLTDPAPADPGR